MHAFRVLEFQAIRARLEEHAETSLGKEHAQELNPSFEKPEVWALLDSTAEAYEALSTHAVPPLGAVKDLRQPLTRAKKGGVLGGQELFLVAEAMAAMRTFKNFLAPLKDEMVYLGPYAEALPDLRKLEETLFDSLDGDGTIKDSASAALGALRAKKRSLNARVLEAVQAYTTGRFRDLLSDPIYTQRDGRYVIPLKSENRGKIRGIVHDTSSSGQTIYLEPENVLQLGNALREAEAAERVEELRILTVLSAKVGTSADEVSGGIEAAARIDFIFARARLAFAMRAAKPQPASGSASIFVHGGRHPLIEPQRVVPLDLSVAENACVLITGPNTGGKTVAIKCLGLFVLMAQSGLFLPAIEVRLSPFVQIWADIGDEQSLEQSLSTFSGHLKNIAEAMKGIKPGALVLLDEVGAGTDPAEGAALAIAILKDIARKGGAVLASTHYGELKAFAYNTPGFSNAAMEFDPKTLKPTYRLIMGAPGASQALRIAERYGIPKDVVDEAREGLGQQQLDLATMMEQLDLAQRQARIAQGEADRRTSELRKLEADATTKLKEADEIRKSANSRAQQAIEGALREIRLEAATLFEQLKKSPSDPKTLDRIRSGLKELDEVGREFATEFAPKHRSADGAQIKIEKGMSVRVEGYTQVGTVIDDPRGNSVLVQLGPIKMSLPVHLLNPTSAPKAAPTSRGKMQLHKAMSASIEVDLRHLRADEAREQLDRFVDDAVLAGLPSVRIVHGKGEGILRKVTQEMLKTHPHIGAYRDGEPTEGGQGVTIATIR
jgi:DNA mismatch repair protein MutS2